MRRLLLAAGLSLLALRAQAAPPDARVGADVARLRVEVDRLAAEVADERRRAQERLQALRAERTELERQLRLEAVRAATLDRIRAEHVARAEGLEGQSQARLAPIRRALDLADAYVDATLPFQRAGRHRALARIRADLAASHPDPARALSQLWRFVEEEEALAEEVSRAQQPITLDGRRQLVDVARLGMAVLYFRAADGRVGHAVREGEGWTFRVVEAPEARDAIAGLFAAFDDNRVLGPQRLLLPEVRP